MKLQINTAGSWKDVVTFDEHERLDVIKALQPLADILSDRAKFCLVNDKNEREWLKLS